MPPCIVLVHTLLLCISAFRKVLFVAPKLWCSLHICIGPFVRLHFQKCCIWFSNAWRLFICLRKLPFCVVLCGQKGHWNWGSFPHSCFRCWLSDGRCWYTLLQFGQLYGPPYRSLPICWGVIKLVCLGREGLENGVPKLAAMPITQTNIHAVSLSKYTTN